MLTINDVSTQKASSKRHQYFDENATFTVLPVAMLSQSEKMIAEPNKKDQTNSVRFFEHSINVAVFSSIGGFLMIASVGFGIWQVFLRMGKQTSLENEQFVSILYQT